MFGVEHLRRLNNMEKFCIHTVFIARENIPFMEEWITHHYNLGIKCFMLYDNSGVQDYCNWDYDRGRHRGMIPGKTNKNGVDFSSRVAMTDEQIDARMDVIKSKFPSGVVNYIKWQPKDENGLIQYNQCAAAEDCHNRIYDNQDWCISIDMDEFVQLGDKFSSIQDVISPDHIDRFDRFTQGKLTEQVYTTRWSLLPEQFDMSSEQIQVFNTLKNLRDTGKRNTPGKYIYRVKKSKPVFWHVHSIKTSTRIRLLKDNDIHIKHFKSFNYQHKPE